MGRAPGGASFRWAFDTVGGWAKKRPVVYPYTTGHCFLSYPKTPARREKR